MIRRAIPLLPFVLIMLSACASNTGFDRTEMQSVMRQSMNLSTLQTTAGMPESIPTISTPFRLGIFFTKKEFPTRESIRVTTWLSQDGDLLIRALAPLRDQQILSDAIVIANPATQNPDLPEIRKTAARYGADVIVIITGAGAVDRHNNGYALLYPTIVGAYLAPGTVSEALFLTEGTLWDVRSGAGLGSETAEGQSKQIGAAMTLDDRDVLRQAKTAALEGFGQRLSDQLSSIRYPPAQPLPR